MVISYRHNGPERLVRPASTLQEPPPDPRVPRPRRWKIMTPAKKEAIRRLRGEGLSHRKIGIEVGVSAPTVERALREMGLA